MKILYLLRHAKSSWENLELDDFDRPLNWRGKQDAPLMGKLLARKSILPDLIISSSSKRTRKTIQKITQEIDYHESNVVYTPELYHASCSEIMTIIRQQSDQIQRLMLVGHNPSFTDFANQFTDTLIENIPTCGFCELHFQSYMWQNITSESARLVCFEYPKKYRSILP